MKRYDEDCPHGSVVHKHLQCPICVHDATIREIAEAAGNLCVTLIVNAQKESIGLNIRLPYKGPNPMTAQETKKAINAALRALLEGGDR
jgi:hypothetical protein